MAGRVIPDELVELIESGVAAIWLATAGADGTPEAARVMGARIAGDGSTLIAFVPVEQGGCTVENLRSNPIATAFFCNVHNFNSIQIKGEVRSARPSDASDRELQLRYRERFADSCTSFGLDREATMRMVIAPSLAVELEVRELFVQTPGPKAGEPWK